MTPTITDEMRDALSEHPDEPLRLEDEQTQKVYVLIDQEEARRLFDAWLHREVQVGLEQADRGELRPWDIDETLADAHRRGGHAPAQVSPETQERRYGEPICG